MEFLQGLFFFSAFLLSTSSAQLDVQNVFAMRGGEAVVNLTTQATLASVQLFRHNPWRLLFDSRNMSNGPKYAFYGNPGNYSIRVSSIETKDGRSYQVQSNLGAVNFNIIVIDLQPPSLVPNNSNNFSVGSTVTVNCTLRWYGSDSGESYSVPIQVGQLPVLGMVIGSNYVNAMGSKLFPDPDDFFYHMYTLQVNQTVTSDWVGKNMTCMVTSPILPHAINTSVVIPIPFRTQNISIWNNMTGLYYNNLGDVVNCTANGYPPPIVSWSVVSSPPGCNQRNSGGYKPYAELIFECQGSQVWNCSAVNMVNGVQSGVWTQQTFNVGYYTNPNDTLPSKEQDNSNAIGLGVGLGIGLGVPLFIGLITLCCCLMKRRKANQGTTRSQPPVNGQPKKTTVTATATAPPIKTSNVKVNLNPNPNLPMPVYEEQKMHVNPVSVRGSAGVADIGVRTVSKSGSLSSQLNESQDSSDHGSATIRPPAKNSSVV